MTATSNPIVVGVGSPMLDILVQVEESFVTGIEGSKGGMELVPPDKLDNILSDCQAKPVRVPGGSAANTIFGLASLGSKTSLLGKVGRDETGEFYMNRYKAMGGDISLFKYHPEIPSGRCLSLVTPDSERTMRTDLGAAATLEPDDLGPEDFKNATHAHIEGYLLFNVPLTRHVLKLAKENQCSISLDLASFEVVRASESVLKELLTDYIDIVFANEDEAEAFSGSADMETALKALGDCCQTVGLKLGENGAIIKNGAEKVRVVAEKVTAVDTTGAGDLWQAGFLYSFLRGETLERCGEYASRLGAEVVQVMGAAIPNERWREIKMDLGIN